MRRATDREQRTVDVSRRENQTAFEASGKCCALGAPAVRLGECPAVARPASKTALNPPPLAAGFDVQVGTTARAGSLTASLPRQGPERRQGERATGWGFHRLPQVVQRQLAMGATRTRITLASDE